MSNHYILDVKWKPANTAPRDGTFILGMRAKGNIVVQCKWDKSEAYFRQVGQRDPISIKAWISIEDFQAARKKMPEPDRYDWMLPPLPEELNR